MSETLAAMSDGKAVTHVSACLPTCSTVLSRMEGCTEIGRFRNRLPSRRHSHVSRGHAVPKVCPDNDCSET